MFFYGANFFAAPLCLLKPRLDKTVAETAVCQATVLARERMPTDSPTSQNSFWQVESFERIKNTWAIKYLNINCTKK